MATELTKLDKARQQLEQAKSVDEIVDIRDKAEVIRLWIKKAGMGLDAQNAAAEIKLRAEWKAGQWLADHIRHEGGRPVEKHTHDASVITLESLGLEDTQSSRWQRIATIPEEDFETFIHETRNACEELTSIMAIRFANKLAQRDKSTAFLPLPDKQYRTIVIDPPWPQQKILRDERPNQAEFAYTRKTIKDIETFGIKNIAWKEGSHLYLWTTHKFLPDALNIVETWGFRYQCLLTWVKNVGITPFSWMYSTEHVIFARLGKLDLLQNGLRLDFAGKVREHSRKPDEFYELVKKASPEPRIDCFSREKREGFDQYGDEPSKF